jgi:nicotinate-nucleotide adenylyltransferase
MKSDPRIGIFGGSFDPVHIGHLLVAWAAREETGLDRMIFVPASLSPFKRDQPPTESGVRLRMLRLALAGLDWCSVSEMEIRRGGVSYAVDTLRELARQHPGAELFYLIGEDNVPKLAEWRESESLMKLARFLVIPRPGTMASQGEGDPRLDRLRGWPIQISSSEIRRRVRDGLPIGHLVPAGVAEAIHNNRLYLG